MLFFSIKTCDSLIIFLMCFSRLRKLQVKPKVEEAKTPKTKLAQTEVRVPSKSKVSFDLFFSH